MNQIDHYIFYYSGLYTKYRLFGVYTSPDASKLPKEFQNFCRDNEGYANTTKINGYITNVPRELFRGGWNLFNRSGETGLYLVTEVPVDTYLQPNDMNNLVYATTNEDFVKNIPYKPGSFYFINAIR